MIASLPMYWRAENAPLWTAFWRQVQDFAASDGLALPDLTPPGDIPSPWTDHWLRPDLALSMTCGLPFRTSLKHKVAYVGTFDFGLSGPAGSYHSRLVQNWDPRDPAPKNLRLAYSAADSQSGWAAAQGSGPHHPQLQIARYVETGGHAASLAAVAEGRADAAFVDAVTWRLLERFDPNAGRVHLGGQSAPTPGLPLIAARGTDVAPLRRALKAATLAFAPDDPAAMGGPIRFHVLDPADYHAVPIPAPPPPQPHT